MFTDEMLRSAAAESAQLFVKSIERDYDPESLPALSPDFEEKMDRLCRRAKRPHLRRGLRWAAAIVLAALTGFTGWMVVDVEARAAVIQWVRTFYEDYVEYDYFGTSGDSAQPEPLPEYDLSVLPPGYKETEFLYDDTMCVKIYSNGTTDIVFTYYVMSDDIIMWIETDDFAYEYEEVYIGGCKADYYNVTDANKADELVLVNELSGVVFCISGHLEKEKMISLAEGIVKF